MTVIRIGLRDSLEKIFTYSFLCFEGLWLPEFSELISPYGKLPVLPAYQNFEFIPKVWFEALAEQLKRDLSLWDDRCYLKPTQDWLHQVRINPLSSTHFWAMKKAGIAEL